MTAQTIATAEAALAALTGNVTHRPTDHEIALAEAEGTTLTTPAG